MDIAAISHNKSIRSGLSEALRDAEHYIISGEKEIYGGYLPSEVLEAIQDKSNNMINMARGIHPKKANMLKELLDKVLAKRNIDISEMYCVWDEVGRKMLDYKA